MKSIQKYTLLSVLLLCTTTMHGMHPRETTTSMIAPETNPGTFVYGSENLHQANQPKQTLKKKNPHVKKRMLKKERCALIPNDRAGRCGMCCGVTLGALLLYLSLSEADQLHEN